MNGYRSMIKQLASEVDYLLSRMKEEPKEKHYFRLAALFSTLPKTKDDLIMIIQKDISHNKILFVKVYLDLISHIAEYCDTPKHKTMRKVVIPAMDFLYTTLRRKDVEALEREIYY